MIPAIDLYKNKTNKQKPSEKVIFLDNAEQRLKQKIRGDPGFPGWLVGTGLSSSPLIHQPLTSDMEKHFIVSDVTHVL